MFERKTIVTSFKSPESLLALTKVNAKCNGYGVKLGNSWT